MPDIPTPWVGLAALLAMFVHICSPEASEAEPPLRGELRRLAPPAELERRPGARISR